MNMTNEFEKEEVKNDQSLVTKEEIMAHLNLGNNDGSIEGNINTGKGGLTKDLIEGLEKDLEKLKRTQENLQMRKLAQTKEGQVQLGITDEMKEKMALDALQNELKSQDAHIINADFKRL